MRSAAVGVHVAAVVSLVACSGSSGRPLPPTDTPAAPPVVTVVPNVAAGPTYDVHEWGLLRGTPDDHVMLSGPRAEPAPMVMAKPVLYFHRHGEGALVVDVEARMIGGRIVEHWPSFGGVPGERATWADVVIQPGSCRGSRYPTLAEEPCSRLTDGCEAATLATVETTDSDCVHWPRPPGGGGPTQAWNHLFYRGETAAAPSLPLHLSPLPDGTLRVTAAGDRRIPGRLVRLRRSNGVVGVTDAAEVVAPPAPGGTVVIASPTGSLSAARASLASSLREAGLTQPETEAFRRSWDDALFGPTVTASARLETLRTETTPVATARPMAPPRATTSLLYVLPQESAEALATLTFTPPPRSVRRAIVVWIDETAAR
ncbi:MAG: hypothetical protein IT379_34095 [Deltaproteobacteria bacterium]|nr:hypothetical protein [Deltaproteobacteria bacterium]